MSKNFFDHNSADVRKTWKDTRIGISVNQLTTPACDGCRNQADVIAFTMAFQPVVHYPTKTIYAHEALVRGLEDQSAYSILSQIGDANRYAFDQACRVKAIELASKLAMKSKLSINFLPNAIYRPEACIKLTLATAQKFEFPVEDIIFELTEDERSKDLKHLQSIFHEYQLRGFVTAIDDFGTGYASFELLANFQPDVIKLDMVLIRDIETHPAKQAIVAGMMQICNSLKIRVIAEGVETLAELRMLESIGLEYFQGYLFARPALECLPTVYWP